MTPHTLTAEQLHTLRHMLGINDPYTKVPQPYRDYYCANHDDAELQELERLGMVRRYHRCESYDWYCTTDAGRAAAMQSHRTIRLSKARRVYAKYLDIRDCFSDLSFRAFLTDPKFAETRRTA